jgi:hypothetical protein
MAVYSKLRQRRVRVIRHRSVTEDQAGIAAALGKRVQRLLYPLHVA